MIQGFSKVVQADFDLLVNTIKGNRPNHENHNQRVNLAAARMFALLGMAGSIIGGCIALRKTSTSFVGGAFIAALSAGVFALSHDVFVMAKNASEQMNFFNRVVNEVAAVVHDIKDILKGNKDVQDVPRQAITKDTLLRPLWDRIGAEIEKRQ